MATNFISAPLWYCCHCYTYHVGSCPRYTAQQPTSDAFVYTSQIPYRCPVCEGRGKVQFDPDDPYQTVAASMKLYDCKPCFGIGVLWR